MAATDILRGMQTKPDSTLSTASCRFLLSDHDALFTSSRVVLVLPTNLRVRQ